MYCALDFVETSCSQNRPRIHSFFFCFFILLTKMFLVLFLDAEDRECSKLLNICFSWKFITPEIGVKISCYTFSDHDELLLWNGWPMSEIITIPNLLTNIRDSYHPRSPTHYKEYLNQFRLYWMKVCSSDSHYTTAPHIQEIFSILQFRSVRLS